jgi:FAD/FMN-containing dehydrogenase
MRALKYGVTRDHVLGLEAVLPGGEVIRAGSRCHKDVCGLDLTRLLVGSEGSLAVITEAVLKLLPLPEASASLLAGFGDLERALAGAGAVFRAGLLPSALEFMDSGVLGALEKARAKSGGEVPWPKATGACLLFKLDGSRAAVGAEIERLREALADSAPTFVKLGTDQEGEEALWDLRRMISPAMHLVAPNKSNDDVAVPRGRVAEAVARYKAIGRERGVGVYCFGHLGDGNIHVDIMYDESDPAQAEAAPQAKKEILRASVEMGGTLTGEHGVGQVKTPYLGMQLGPAERGLMARVKAAFDPSGILNPGKAL